MKTGFVILHYQNIEVTYKCLNLLLKLQDIQKSEVIVVDNASLNGSGQELKKAYINHKNIHVVMNSRNEGFARGNNIGYQLAKKVYGCDNIVVMNSDVYIEQNDFIIKINERFTDNPECSIIAPDIYAMKGYYQNPISLNVPTKQFADFWYFKVSTMAFLLQIPIVSTYVAKMIIKKRAIIEENKASLVDTRKAVKAEGITPHGACVIFGNNWVKKEDIAFIPYTFLYAEEYLLSYYAYANGYKCVFFPNIKVVHEAGASTQIDEKQIVVKLRFAYRNEIESIKQLRRLIKDGGRIHL